MAGVKAFFVDRDAPTADGLSDAERDAMRAEDIAEQAARGSVKMARAARYEGPDVATVVKDEDDFSHADDNS